MHPAFLLNAGWHLRERKSPRRLNKQMVFVLKLRLQPLILKERIAFTLINYFIGCEQHYIRRRLVFNSVSVCVCVKSLLNISKTNIRSKL